MSDTRSPETSIVIRAFNEERWLPEVLQAIATQSYRDFEVILVDSGSVDRTREIAAVVRRPDRPVAARGFHLRAFAEPRHPGGARIADRDPVRPRDPDRCDSGWNVW